MICLPNPVPTAVDMIAACVMPISRASVIKPSSMYSRFVVRHFVQSLSRTTTVEMPTNTHTTLCTKGPRLRSGVLPSSWNRVSRSSGLDIIVLSSCRRCASRRRMRTSSHEDIKGGNLFRRSEDRQEEASAQEKIFVVVVVETGLPLLQSHGVSLHETHRRGYGISILGRQSCKPTNCRVSFQYVIWHSPYPSSANVGGRTHGTRRRMDIRHYLARLRMAGVLGLNSLKLTSFTASNDAGPARAWTEPLVAGAMRRFCVLKDGDGLAK